MALMEDFVGVCGVDNDPPCDDGYTFLRGTNPVRWSVRNFA